MEYERPVFEVRLLGEDIIRTSYLDGTESGSGMEGNEELPFL